jgi:transcriptional regulator with XRE-family HTH domain
MNFPARLIQLRKRHDFTKQGPANTIELNVNQIKRYESVAAQPPLDTLIRLAKDLHVSLDELVFEDAGSRPNEELRLQFEAIARFTPEEKKIAKAVLENLILAHDANRFSATG